MKADPIEVAQKVPEPVLISREESEKLFEPSPETVKFLRELAEWRERSMRSDFVFGGPG